MVRHVIRQPNRRVLTESKLSQHDVTILELVTLLHWMVSPRDITMRCYIGRLLAEGWSRGKGFKRRRRLDYLAQPGRQESPESFH